MEHVPSFSLSNLDNRVQTVGEIREIKDARENPHVELPCCSRHSRRLVAVRAVDPHIAVVRGGADFAQVRRDLALGFAGPAGRVRRVRDAEFFRIAVVVLMSGRFAVVMVMSGWFAMRDVFLYY